MSASFSVIVKNEATRIADIIRNLRPMTEDPITVIDQGSTDDTIKIVQSIPNTKIMALYPGASPDHLLSFLAQQQTESPELQAARQAMEKYIPQKPIKTFALPACPSLSVLACFAVKRYQELNQDIEIAVAPGTDWAEDVAKAMYIKIHKDNPIFLELPENYADKHVCEWVCRSMGCVYNEQQLFQTLAFDNSLSRQTKLLLNESGVNGNEWWQTFKGILVENKIAFDTCNDDDLFSKVFQKMVTSSMYVGETPWIGHVARWTGTKTITFWNDNPKHHGWKQHDNRFQNSDPYAFAEEIMRKLNHGT